MILFTHGSETYFNPRLLQHTMAQENEQAIMILQSHRPDELRQLRDNSQATLLHHAAKYGNAVIVNYLLESNCEIDAQDDSGKTPLMLALTNGQKSTVQLLISANANIRLTDSQGKSVIHMIFEAHKLHRWDMLEIIFQRTTWQKLIEVVAPNDLAKKLIESGYTTRDVLRWENVELMELMLSREKNSIDARKPGYGDRTLLHIAIQLGLIMLKVLINRGANVDVLDDWKATALLYFYDGMQSDVPVERLEVLRILTSRATLLTTSDAHGFMQIANVLANGNNDAIEVALGCNVDLTATDERGNNALHYLAANGKVNLFELLRGRKFDVNSRGEDGDTPLHVAVLRKSFLAVDFLLENGADVNAINEYGRTPLYLAFPRRRGSNEGTVKLLLQYGADPQIYDNNGTTIFDLAKWNLRMNNRVNYLNTMRSVIARLAVVEGLGVEITELVRSRMSVVREWVEYFVECQREVERMKEMTMCNRLTLFQFLTVSRRKAIACVRNEEWVSKIESIVDRDSPYFGMIRRRLKEMVSLEELWEKAVGAVCGLIGLKVCAFYDIAEDVVDYLSVRDIKTLDSVWND